MNPFPTPLSVPIYWEVARYYSLETILGLHDAYVDQAAFIQDHHRDGSKRVGRRRLTETWQSRGYPLPHPLSKPLVIRLPNEHIADYKVMPGRIMEIPKPDAVFVDHWAPDDSTPYRPVEVLTEPETTSGEADMVSESEEPAAHPTSIEEENHE